MLNNGGASQWTLPPTVSGYSAQAQATHSHTSQVQVSPLQFGHAQTSQPQLAACVVTFVVVTAQQVLEIKVVVSVATACWHPQLPHWQTSQVQNSPLQSGHLQSTQPQDDFARLSDEGCPAGANV